MTSRALFSAVALATLALLSACGGGDASGDAGFAQPQAVGGGAATAQDTGGIGGSGKTALDTGGIGGSGKTAQDTGGIGGSGKTAQDTGGIGGSGKTAQDTGGIGGSGKTAQDTGGIGGSGKTAQAIGGVGGTGATPAAAAQACGLQSVNVTVAAVRVNRNGAADLGSSGWIDVPLAAPVRVDLLALASGAALPIDLGGLPAGTYRQMRLLLVEDDAAAPLADSVVTTGRVETALAVPGAAQGGLPLATAITVADGQVAASWRGLDVCKAVTTVAAGTLQLDAVTQGATQVATAF